MTASLVTPEQRLEAYAKEIGKLEYRITELVDALRACVDTLMRPNPDRYDPLNLGRLGPMAHWPQGANGPLAVAAYESLRDDAIAVIDHARQLLARIEKEGSG